MSSEKGNNIVDYFNTILRQYDSIRGKDKSKLGSPYWDVVVLTTADDDQKKVYEEQIKYKYDRAELPLGVPIHVISDPPGPKLGNGGSTLTTLKFLNETYGESLSKYRVLLIHAGGQSQRMPSASVLGKIFSPIPKGNPMYQMLDIKLAMFCPLISFMGPGVFVTCADDFLVYRLDDLNGKENGIKFSDTGFTALAHPSTLQVGTGHGVYVIKDIERVDPKVPLQMCKCWEVLQKPSEPLMYEKGAVLKSENLRFSDGIQVFGRAAYTDSSFFFSHDVTEKFLSFLKNFGEITCEIDAYGDFLQALGSCATSNYIFNTSNVSKETPELIKTRKEVFDLLKGTEISLLVMNSSKFIHIGTTKEYINYFCCDHSFHREMGLSKDVFNLWNDDPGEKQTGAGDCENSEPASKKVGYSRIENDTALGCVMHSILPRTSNIPATAVVEYCNFSVPVNVGQSCIISNCEYDPTVKVEGSNVKVSGSDENDLLMLDFPNDIFIHTIPIKDDEITKYVTVFFDIKDNLKKEAPGRDVRRLPFLGKLVEDYAITLGIDLLSVESNEANAASKVNLWFSSLFPVADSMSQSLRLALKCIDALKKDDSRSLSLRSTKLVSMSAILKTKNVFSMLAQRNEIYNAIKKGACKSSIK